ncbi:MAG: hypothetical protein AB7F89_18850 [Pirellulaceae bacterium]
MSDKFQQLDAAWKKDNAQFLLPDSARLDRRRDLRLPGGQTRDRRRLQPNMSIEFCERSNNQVC